MGINSRIAVSMAAGLLLLKICASSAAQVQVEKIAFTFDVANPSTGEYFMGEQSFTPPRVNDRGRAAFAAMSSQNFGVWAGIPGQLNVIAEGGWMYQGVLGSYSLMPHRPFGGAIIAANGDVAFAAAEGVLHSSNGQLRSIVRSGDPAIGGGQYVPFIGQPFDFGFSPRISPSGSVAIRVVVGNVPPSVNLQVVSGEFGALTRMLNKGEMVALPDLIIASFAAPRIVNDGSVLVWGSLEGASVDNTNDGAIMRAWPDGSVSMALRESDLIPERGGRTLLNIPLSFNANPGGVVVARAPVSDPVKVERDAIVSRDLLGAHIVVMRGDAAPGFAANQKFVGFSVPAINRRGDLCFFADVGANDASSQWGLYRLERGALSVVAKSFETAPGCGGATFGDSTYGGLTAINDRDHIVFLADLSDGSRGLFGLGDDGIVRFVAATQRGLEVASGDTRIVSLLMLAHEVDHYDLASREAISNDGHIAFLARFNDGSEGVFRAHLPVTPTCGADVNFDGVVTEDDYDEFAEAFEAGTSDADVNVDGFVNGDDYDAFAEAFEAGC